MKGSAQQGFCKIRAIEYRLKDICNSNRLLYLGRINEKVTAKQATGMLIPVLRKAPNDSCNFMERSLQFYWELYSEYYSNEQIVHRSFNPLRNYEEEFINGPILDIGCGQSNFLIEYSITNRDIYAVDNEKYQLE